MYYSQLPSCADPNPPGSLCPLGQFLEGGPRLALAISATAVSVGSLVTGGVLWGLGAKKMRRAREMKIVGVHPFVAPVHGGVMAGLRLVTF